MRANSRPWLTPGSSESPSLCRWECLSHKGACYLDCLSLKISSSNNVRNVKYVMFSTRAVPSWWSDVLQASMKVCATTLRHESTMFAFPRSNTKFGFLIRFTQNLQEVALKHSSSDKEGQNISLWLRYCRYLRIMRLAINHYPRWQEIIINEK